MKITRRQLRRIIEMAMIKPDQASTNLALAYDDNPNYQGMRHFVLFDLSQGLKSLNRRIKTNQMYELRTDKGAVQDAISSAALAVMEVKDHNGLWEGKRVAAEKGYGPTMYETMMMIAPVGFMSDRTGYSSSHTHPIWDKYMQRAQAGDVKLSDVPEEFKISDGTDWQSYIFKIQDNESTRQLKSNYDNYLMQAKNLSPELAQIKLKQELYLMGIVGDMFGSKYEEAGYFGGGEDY